MTTQNLYKIGTPTTQNHHHQHPQSLQIRTQNHGSYQVAKGFLPRRRSHKHKLCWTGLSLWEGTSLKTQSDQEREDMSIEPEIDRLVRVSVWQSEKLMNPTYLFHIFPFFHYHPPPFTSRKKPKKSSTNPTTRLIKILATTHSHKPILAAQPPTKDNH